MATFATRPPSAGAAASATGAKTVSARKAALKGEGPRVDMEVWALPTPRKGETEEGLRDRLRADGKKLLTRKMRLLWREVEITYWVRRRRINALDAYSYALHHGQAVRYAARYYHPDVNALMRAAGEPEKAWKDWHKLVLLRLEDVEMPERPPLPVKGERRKARPGYAAAPETARQVICKALEMAETPSSLAGLHASVGQCMRLSPRTVENILFGVTSAEERFYLRCRLLVHNQPSFGERFIAHVVWPEVEIRLAMLTHGTNFHSLIKEVAEALGMENPKALWSNFYKAAMPEMLAQVREALSNISRKTTAP